MIIKSAGFDALELVDRYFLLARAYLDAAISQCEILATKPSRQPFANACVVLWLARHATEIFYKGGLCHATGQVPPPMKVRRKGKNISVGGHNILYYSQLFRDHFPEAEFPFDAPAKESLMGPEWPAEDLAEALVMIGKRHERYRYPVDSSGKSFSSPHVLDPKSYLRSLKRARREMILCTGRMKRSHGKAANNVPEVTARKRAEPNH